MEDWWPNNEAMYTEHFAAHVAQTLEGLRNGAIERPDVHRILQDAQG